MPIFAEVSTQAAQVSTRPTRGALPRRDARWLDPICSRNLLDRERFFLYIAARKMEDARKVKEEDPAPVINEMLKEFHGIAVALKGLDFYKMFMQDHKVFMAEANRLRRRRRRRGANDMP